MAIGIKANNSSRAKSRVLGVLIALGVIVIVCILTAISTAETKKTISVVRIGDNNVAANSLITEAVVEEYKMYYKEFEQYGTFEDDNGQKLSTIVKWDNRDWLLGKRYAAYYLRKNTVVFWDSTLAEQKRKNSYLYSMSGELLNIHMSTTDDFGGMAVPGDSLNIRANWTETQYDLPSEEQYKLQADLGNAQDAGVEVDKSELMFSEVQILDMLNSEGNSIFDIYYDYIAMSDEEKQTALADESFLESVTPESILLECTAEEVDRYTELQSKGASYQMTLLPRSTSSVITDGLSEIQTALAGIANSEEE